MTNRTYIFWESTKGWLQFRGISLDILPTGGENLISMSKRRGEGQGRAFQVDRKQVVNSRQWPTDILLSYVCPQTFIGSFQCIRCCCGCKMHITSSHATYFDLVSVSPGNSSNVLTNMETFFFRFKQVLTLPFLVHLAVISSSFIIRWKEILHMWTPLNC